MGDIMVKIAENDINQIRNNANIVDVISSYINLEPKGKNFFGICPFHDDHNPSMSVSPDKQIYTCFVCGASGNVFTFVQNYENVSFLEAVKIVADKVGYRLNINVSTVRANQKYYDMLELANKYFINNLNGKDGEAAKRYLINERKLDEKVIDEFNIGLALNDNNLTKLLVSKGYSDKDIVNLSLGNYGDSLTDMFRGRITFPICNDKGEVVAFSARIYNTESDNKYLNSRENVLFKKGHILYNYDKCKAEVSKKKQVILVEGQMDAIRVYSTAFKNVCATMGTALTKDHITLLKRLNAKVILCMDNDSAGAKSTISNGEALVGAGIEVLVVRLAGAKDPDSYILEFGADKFKDAINGAVSYFDFKLNVLKNKKNLNKDTDLADYINDVILELNKSDDEILKSITINNISKEYGIDKDLLMSKLVKKEAAPKIEVKKVSVRKLDKNSKICEALLAIMMSNSKYIRLYERRLGYIPDKKYRLIANDILAYYKLYGEFNVADFITYVSSFDYSDLILKIINNINKVMTDEFDIYVNYIKIWINEEKIKEIKEEIKKLTDVNEKERMNDLIIKLKRRGEDNEED